MSKMFDARVVADSIHNGNQLTTLELEYPRYIHSEFMTHRVFSRNAQSFRAMPVEKLIKRIEENNWYPIFMKNKKGMSAIENFDEQELEDLKYLWFSAKKDAINKARDFVKKGVHKQIVNRILEPFSTIKVIVSSTEWDNFFSLRIHPEAQQEIQILAKMMKDAIDNSVPIELDYHEFHLPYIGYEDRYLPMSTLIEVSTARLARVSYLSHDGKRDIDKEVELHNSLLTNKHMSPFEHVARPMKPYERKDSNFTGWKQYRKIVEENNRLYHIENGNY